MPPLAALTLLLAVLLAVAIVRVVRLRAELKAARQERDHANRAAEETMRAALEERGQADEAKTRAQLETDRAQRAKDDFIATVSHELRTPLNAVLGWARLLRLGKLDPERTAHAIEVIERSASAQAQIVDDLLDVSRILRGDLRLDLRPLELISVVEAAIEAVRPAAEARGIQLGAALLPHSGRVVGDPGRLQQVVWNLLANAIKFTPPGGRVEVRLDQQGPEVVVQVRDSGPGIDPSFVPHLFERFRQADSSSTRLHGGLGLGLSIVRQLVEAHRGTVSAHSPGAGAGSLFVVRLPVDVPRPRGTTSPGQQAAPGTTAAAPGGPPLRAPGGTPAPDTLRLAEPAFVPRSLPATPVVGLAPLDRLHVLVVDDDEDSLEVLREILEGAGAQVSVAASARAAMARFDGAPPDVMLSDIGMPGEDGYALIRRVRGLPAERGGRIPAAALTAYTQAEDREAALAAGFHLWLSKPIEPGALTSAVARLAGRAP